MPVVFCCVPGMAQFLRVKVPSRVFTAKCSEPQADASNGGGGGSGVAKPRSLRTETGYKAKRWVTGIKRIMLCAVCRRLQHLRQKRDGSKPCDGIDNELAGKKAATQGKRNIDKGGAPVQECLPRIHILEEQRRLEAQAGKRQKSKAL